MAILGRRHSLLNRPRNRGARGLETAVFVLRCLLILVVSLGLTMLIAPSVQAQRGADIHALKAAFIYQFTNFIEWPKDAFEGPRAPFTVGVVGNDELAMALESAVHNKSVGKHPFRVLSLEATDDVSSCQIVYVAERDEVRRSAIFAQTFEASILTVGDSDDFTQAGGVIRLYEEASKLRIEINVDAAERAELKVSSKLLTLGRVVRDDRS